MAFSGESSIGNQLQFTARRIDPETGLHQYRARYYSADLGRFVSSDPIGAWGDAGNLGNSYAYIGNSPYWSTDASGMHSDVTSWWVCEGSSYRDGNCRSSSPWSANSDHCFDTVGGHTQQYTGHNENLDHAMTCTYRATAESPAPQQNPQGQASGSEQTTSETPRTSPPPETPPNPPSPPPPPPPPPPPLPQAPAKKTSLWGKFKSAASDSWDNTNAWAQKNLLEEDFWKCSGKQMAGDSLAVGLSFAANPYLGAASFGIALGGSAGACWDDHKVSADECAVKEGLLMVTGIHAVAVRGTTKAAFALLGGGARVGGMAWCASMV